MCSSDLGIYTYVRHSESFSAGVEDLLSIPGELHGVLAIYGSLSAIHLGIKGIPKPLRTQLSLYPYSAAWVQQYVDRCLDWPHGTEDIQRTRSLPSHPVGQILRNLSRASR